MPTQDEQIGDEQGYAMFTRGGLSYHCPRLRLFGLRDDRALRNAIRRELRKRAKRAAQRAAQATE